MGLFGQRIQLPMINCDIYSCMKLLLNPVHHDKMKDVEMKYHYV